MGKTAADVQREIEELRKETTLFVGELESRLRDAANVPAQVGRHPVIAAGVGLSLLGGLAFAGYVAYGRVQEKRKPAARLRQQMGEIKGALGEQGKGRGQTFPSRVEESRDEGMLKRVLYAAMTAAMVALATFLARRVAETIWSKTMQERPPGEPQ